jgi:gas vesicle protein
MSTKSDVSSFFSGFFIGALIGAATAFLLAPQSGEETRTQLREKGIELREKAEVTYGDVLHRVEAATQDLRKRTEEISVKVDQVIAQGKDEIAKISKRGKEVEEAVEEAVEETAEEAEA